MEAKIAVIHPRGAGGRFVMSLLERAYDIEPNHWYDKNNNEYNHHRAAYKTPGNVGKSFVWDDQWKDYGQLVVENAVADQICCAHNGSGVTAEKVYHMTADHSFDYVSKLAMIKLFTRSFSYETNYNRPVDLHRWIEYLHFLKENGVFFPPINKFFSDYFYHNKDWDWDVFCFKLQRKFDKRKAVLISKYQEDKKQNIPTHAVSFEYNQLLDQTTGTVLDNYKDDIDEYHLHNVQLVDKFERVFQCLL